MNIYVGNLSTEITEEELKEHFIKFGTVTSCKIIKDKFTGESRGFGFVEMPSKEQAQNAIQLLNGQEIHGKSIVVNEARPRGEKNRKFFSRRSRKGHHRSQF
ncbi:MAG: RNA-binding protein [Endomicrobia bacterium]|nr:RNA-binding protein [Endomicrobiia bacterium]MCX7715868.1 RNA-binding protein [Endomicrobiia bacterium]